jgi:glycosyltransferase involved in cell wall biosynthesis
MAPRHRPGISIGLPVYNGERYLGAALDCFLAQTFGDFELTICDNASTDRTAEIAQAYGARDQRIRYHRNERNLGAIPNFNRAFALSSAPLFKWIAHDDLYEADYLESCVSLLRRHPDAVLAHSATRFIDDAGVPFPAEPETGGFVDPKTHVLQFPDSPAIADHPSPVERFRQVLARARWGSHMFGLMRTDALARTRLVPDFAGGDRAMLAELALLGRFVASREPLFSKRFHENVSWALKQTELKRFMNTDGQAYSRRRRQLATFFSAPWRSPIDPLSKLACTGLIALHTVKVAVDAAGGKEARNAAQGRLWRRNTAVAS